MRSCHLIGRWAGRPLALLALTWATNASAQAVPEGWAAEGFIYCAQPFASCITPYADPVVRLGTASSFVQQSVTAAKDSSVSCQKFQNFNGPGACYIRASNAADAAAAQDLLNQQYIATGKVFGLMLCACTVVWGARRVLTLLDYHASGERS